MVKSRKAKLIQTGSIHAYLGYIFGTLVILFMFVIAGGNLDDRTNHFPDNHNSCTFPAA